jgi:hypothetical protein
VTPKPSAHAGQSGDEFFSNDRTSGQDEAIVLPEGGYGEFLFDLDDSLLARYRGLRYDDYARERVAPTFVQELLGDWERLYQEPFRGVTSNGVVEDGLYSLGPTGASSPEPRIAAERALAALDPDERVRFRYDLDAREWRAWSNPEFVIHPVGVRLEDLDDNKVAAILGLVRACLSAEGYELVCELMELNGFLGNLTDLPTVMNPRSYSIALFGTPSDDAPWGWQLFGHHVALNFVSVGGRQVIAPVFLGAEPAVSLDGRPPVFADRVAVALELAGSLTPEQRADAVVFDSVLDPAMPADRLHPADERHVAGAFRDNRVIPYEGISAGEFSSAQWSQLRQLIADFLVLLVEPHREATLMDVDAHRDDTHFSWYGATDGSQPFYFRIQSPVIFAELDHHAGVWLTNQLPARFHIHTTLRLPNGNDYARKYIAQWREQTGAASVDDKWVD